MAKGYWVAAYHTLPDHDTLANVYGPLAEAAVKAGDADSWPEAGSRLGASSALDSPNI